MAVYPDSTLDEVCFTICPTAILLLIALIASAFYYRVSRKEPEYISFQHAFQFYSISILRIGHTSSMVIGLFLVLIGLLMVIFVLLEFILVFILFGFMMIPIGSLLIITGLSYGKDTRNNFVTQPPWTNAITQKKRPVTPASISSLFSYLKNLKLLVSWLTIAGTLVTIWGILDVPGLILFMDQFGGYDHANLYLIMPVLKLVIGTTLLIGSKQIMLKPLRSPGFWNRALISR